MDIKLSYTCIAASGEIFKRHMYFSSFENALRELCFWNCAPERWKYIPNNFEKLIMPKNKEYNTDYVDK